MTLPAPASSTDSSGLTMSYELTEADRIWNRACLGDADNLRIGDRALAAMLYIHGYVMNGGVEHVVECASVTQLAAGIEGYRYFGLDNLASLITKAQGTDEILGETIDAEYFRLGCDSILERHFKKVYADHPADFEPLDSH